MTTIISRSLTVGPIASLVFAWIVGLGNPEAALAQKAPNLDPDFKPVISRISGFGSALGVQPDGKIIVAGGFNAVNGAARSGLVRLEKTGSVDASFVSAAICCGAASGNTDATAPISALTIQPDGKILLGGSFTNIGGVPRIGLARLNQDGSLDSTFDSGTGLAGISLSSGLLPVAAMVLQKDGKVLLGGYFTAVNGVPRSGLARLNADGSVDTTFNPGSGLAIGFPDFGPLTGLILLPNDQILVAGSFQAIEDVKRNGIARLNADGSLDAAFNPLIVQEEGAPPSISGVLVQSDGGILISGGFYAIDSEFPPGLARLKPDGTLDSTFQATVDTANEESFRLLRLQADGKILAYRQFNDSGNIPHRVIARLNQDGAVDSTFALELAPQDSRLQLRQVILQADGELLIAGNLSAESDSTHEGLLRANSTGQLDNGFGPRLELAEGSDFNVLTVAIQADGKVLVGGTFSRINGVDRTQLARLNRDGSLDTAFAPVLESNQPTSSVASLAVQPDGKILVGGDFATVNKVSRNGIARLNADGTLDATFDPGAGTKEGDPAGEGAIGLVAAIALQPDGKALLAGGFTTLTGQPVPYLGRLNANGTLDPGFVSGVGLCFTCDPPDIRQLGVLTNGEILVSGSFSRVEAFSIHGITMLHENGSVDLALMPAIATEEEVSAMAVGPDNKTVVAIAFSDPATSRPSARFLRFNRDGTPDAGFIAETVTGDALTTAPISALTIDPQGRILVAGQFIAIGSAARRGLARLKADGTLDTTFDAGAGFGSAIFPPSQNQSVLVNQLALQDDGGIVAGGDFGTANNQVRLGVARFQADSSGPPLGGGPTLTGLARSASGSVSMLVVGEAGHAYRIEASADLRVWTAVGEVTGAASPQLFNDTSPTATPYRFYRAVVQ